MKETSCQLSRLDQMKKEREELRNKLVNNTSELEALLIRHRTLLRERDAWRVKYAKLDRAIFEVDPGVTVLPPQREIKEKIKTAKRIPKKLTKDNVTNVLGNDLMKNMLEKLLESKRAKELKENIS